MSIYGTDALNSTTNDVNMNAVVEDFLYDDISRGTDEQIKEFCESDAAKVLEAANVLRKPTLMRLGKSDDLKRRQKLTALELARQANDPIWKKLAANRKKEKQYINQIMKKYGNKANKVAKVAQKDYVKAAKTAKNTSSKSTSSSK